MSPGLETAHAAVRARPLEDGRVLDVLLDRPKGNVLTREVMVVLGEALARHDLDPRLKLVVLRGAGGNFSFG